MVNLLRSHVLRDHVLIGGLAAWLLMPWLGTQGSVLFWVSTVLMDVDHYLNFLYFTRFRAFKVGDMFRFYERIFPERHRPEFLAVDLFHTAEFMMALAVIAFGIIPWLGPIFFGFLFHLLVDFVHLTRFRALTKRCHSLIEYFWRRKRFAATGRNPDLIFAKALNELGLPSAFYYQND